MKSSTARREDWLDIRLAVSAYACDPDRGSEPGAGWSWLAAAAAVVPDVTVFTREKNVEPVRRALAARDTHHVQVVGLEAPRWARTLKHRLPFGTQLYYLVWQRSLARQLARGSHSGFDLAHHLTFAMDWLPAGVSALDCPLVWGPVGGRTRVSLRQLRLLLPEDRLGELLRNVVTWAGRLTWGRPTASRAALRVYQNQDEIHAFGPHRAVIEPNVVAEPCAPRRVPDLRHDGRRTALVIGRLVGWKGMHHAIAALAHSDAQDWRLTIVGSGRKRRRLERIAASADVADRVAFVGQLDRAEVVALLGTADALVSASLHEAAGFAVAEAVAAGCPVVYVDQGGPSELVPTGRGIQVRASGRLDVRIAHALGAVDGRHVPSARWSADRLPDLLRGFYERALESR